MDTKTPFLGIFCMQNSCHARYGLHDSLESFFPAVRGCFSDLDRARQRLAPSAFVRGKLPRHARQGRSRAAARDAMGKRLRGGGRGGPGPQAARLLRGGRAGGVVLRRLARVRLELSRL